MTSKQMGSRAYARTQLATCKCGAQVVCNGEPGERVCVGVCQRCGEHCMAVPFVRLPRRRFSLVVVDCRADPDRLECGECGEMTAKLQGDRPADVVPIR